MSIDHMEHRMSPCRMATSAIRCEKRECGIRGLFAVSCYQCQFMSIVVGWRNIHFPFDGSDVVRHSQGIENRGVLRKTFKQ